MNDHGEVQGIENSHDEVDVGGKKEKRSCIKMRDVNKIDKENAGQLSYPGYIPEIWNLCVCSSGYAEMNC